MRILGHRWIARHRIMKYALCIILRNNYRICKPGSRISINKITVAVPWGVNKIKGRIIKVVAGNNASSRHSPTAPSTPNNTGGINVNFFF